MMWFLFVLQLLFHHSHTKNHLFQKFSQRVQRSSLLWNLCYFLKNYTVLFFNLFWLVIYLRNKILKHNLLTVFLLFIYKLLPHSMSAIRSWGTFHLISNQMFQCTWNSIFILLFSQWTLNIQKKYCTLRVRTSNLNQYWFLPGSFTTNLQQFFCSILCYNRVNLISKLMLIFLLIYRNKAFSRTNYISRP